MLTMTANRKLIIFSALGTIIVLWQMLLPGYVLTLDMVFGPQASWPTLSAFTTSSYPIEIFLYFTSFVLPGWLIQKIILLAIFFLLFYLPARFYLFAEPKEKSLGQTYAPYAVALFYVINPFVYERFMAGQWMILAAYCLMPAFVFSVVDFYRRKTWLSALAVFVWLFLIGLFSLHFLVMGTLIFTVSYILFLVWTMTLKQWPVFWSAGVKILSSALGFLLISSYWLVPYTLSAKSSALAVINQAHWTAFRTAGDSLFGLVGNVVALYGFWPEHEPWIKSILFPKNNYGWWLFFLVLTLVLVFLGARIGLYNSKTRRRSIFLAILFLLALIFSCGYGESIFKPITVYLFEHVGFWSGFRDTEKWSSLIALVYAMFAGLGIGYLVDRCRSIELKNVFFFSLCLLPLFYTPYILFGFWGQLKTVWYPDSWSQLNNLLRADKDCKAIFLPWHQYYSLSFNNKKLTNNVSRLFFNCQIVDGRNMELGEIVSQGGNGPEYDQVEAIVTYNKYTSEQADAAVAKLKALGIKYVILSMDLERRDPYRYTFLKSKLVRVQANFSGIHLLSL